MGFWGAVPRGVPGGTFRRLLGPRGGTITIHRNDYKRFRRNYFDRDGGLVPGDPPMIFPRVPPRYPQDAWDIPMIPPRVSPRIFPRIRHRIPLTSLVQGLVSGLLSVMIVESGEGLGRLISGYLSRTTLLHFFGWGLGDYFSLSRHVFGGFTECASFRRSALSGYSDNAYSRSDA